MEGISLSTASLFSFFNDYPIFPVSVIVANILAFSPLIFLLYISRNTPLHGNCRYILSVWTVSYGGFFVINIAIVILDLKNASGFMPLSMIDPPLRSSLYHCYYHCTIFCSLFEIVLSIERILSIIHPNSYHHSGTAWKTLLAVTTALVVFAKIVQVHLYSDENLRRLFAYTVLYCIELGVLGVGIVATRVCRKTYEKMYGNSTLTARYQAKEAYEMSRAMIPGYIISFLLKVSTIVVISIYMELKDNNLTGYAQNYLILATVGCGTFSMINLLLKHPQLRRQSLSKLYQILRIDAPVEDRRLSTVVETDTYFSMLTASWK